LRVDRTIEATPTTKTQELTCPKCGQRYTAMVILVAPITKKRGDGARALAAELRREEEAER